MQRPRLPSHAPGAVNIFDKRLDIFFVGYIVGRGYHFSHNLFFFRLILFGLEHFIEYFHHKAGKDGHFFVVKACGEVEKAYAGVVAFGKVRA